MYHLAACMMSLVISNLACIVLCSYFSSIVLSKRNLLNRVSIKSQGLGGTVGVRARKGGVKVGIGPEKAPEGWPQREII